MPAPVLVTPPASEPFTVAEVKEWLQIVTIKQDAVIQGLIKAARRLTEQVTNRALVSATYDWVLDCFIDPARLQRLPPQVRNPWTQFGGRGGPCALSPLAFPDLPADEPIRLPLAPVTSIASISYLDPDGVSQALASSVFDLDAPRSIVYLKDGQVWPDTQGVRNAVTVQFVAGYATADDVPDDIKTGMLMLIAHWFENRTTTDIADGFRIKDVPWAYEVLVGGSENVFVV